MTDVVTGSATEKHKLLYTYFNVCMKNKMISKHFSLHKILNKWKELGKKSYDIWHINMTNKTNININWNLQSFILNCVNDQFVNPTLNLLSSDKFQERRGDLVQVVCVADSLLLWQHVGRRHRRTNVHQLLSSRPVVTSLKRFLEVFRVTSGRDSHVTSSNNL